MNVCYVAVMSVGYLLSNIIESVDSINRDGPDMYICVIHYKKTPNISEKVNLEDF